ncbi:MAG: phosphopyruvate hydratase [Candidatus Doudnabacteria bacterium]|nr:phosphopyruvate hydratase [Candidatus Doudnabacteria bacterium]
MKITKIQALEVLDSRGNPTVQTTVWAGDLSAKASVPSGASTGVHEALELRDNDKYRFGGKGVLKACLNVEKKIFKALKGLSVADQQKIDRTMLELDGTANKAKLGANAILSVSLATARLAAKAKKIELYEYLAATYGYKVKSLPTPFFNVINGGVHADSGLDIQEFFLIPLKGNFANKLRMAAEVFHSLKSQLAIQGLATSVGDEGGFAPKLSSNEDALKQLETAIKSAKYKLGSDFALGLDAASSEFFDEKKGVYELKASNITATPANVYQIYKKWLAKYPLLALEDGCAQDDFSGWKALTQNLGDKTLLIGDDIFVTNPIRIQMGIEQKIANAVLIKVNQIGTLTETIDAIKLSQKHKYKIVFSHRSGETCDSFIADLAVATNADYIKSGAPSRGERLAKYNRLMEIEEQLTKFK